jgi:hypothetical protein
MTMTLVSISSQLSNTLTYYFAKNSLIKYYPIGSSPPLDYLSNMDAKCTETFNKLAVTVKPLVSFLVGALVGTAAMKNIQFYSLFIVVTINALFILDLTLGPIIMAWNEPVISTLVEEIVDSAENNGFP